MHNPERAKWSAETFRAEFEALNRDLIHENNPDWDERQLEIAQLMNEIGQDFLECYEMVAGEWMRRDRAKKATPHPTTLHGFETFLRGGGAYTVTHSSLDAKYILFFRDGRFYVQREAEQPQPYTTVGMAIVALLYAVGAVEVPHA